MLHKGKLSRTLRLIITLGMFVFPCFTVIADWDIPAELDDKLASLNEDQRAFIESGAAIDFMPERQLIHELSTRSEESVQQFINDVMALANEMVYDPERDMGAMPLNLEAVYFHGRSVATPAPLRELKRSPGPFSVHRYVFPETGVPTFAGARVAIYPEDLVAGAVDVAIIGIPNDMSSGRRGARFGPDQLRAATTLATPDTQSLLDPLATLSVVDYGDFSVDDMSVERTVDHITKMVAETLDTGAVPMLVGGDTSMLYPSVKGAAQVRGAGSFGLLHFSAHPDADRQGVHTASDDQALYLLLSQDIVKGKDTIQVGMRGPAVNEETLQWFRDNDVRYHTMAEIHQRGLEKTLQRVRSEVDKGPDAFFVSVDVSVIEPSEMVAAGRITADGLRVQQLAEAIRYVCASKEVAGFEISDMVPVLDYSRMSVTNASTLLNACLVGMAVRKAGLKPDYVHPLAADHGRK